MNYKKTSGGNSIQSWILFAVFAALLVLMNGINISDASAQEAKYPTKPVAFLAQGPPGSGFDTATRTVVNTLLKEKLVPVALPIENAPSSTVGPTTAHRHNADPYFVTVQSISMPFLYATGGIPYSYKDFTPLVGLMNSYYGIGVRQDSSYKTLGDLIKDLKEQPEKTPLCGGRSDDRVFYGATFMKAGVDITKINYVAFGGGTEASVLLLEGSAKAIISTVDDIMGLAESKKIRFLAVGFGKRATEGALKDVPTLKEAGIDLEWANTRYALGGPNMPGYAVKYWKETLTKMMKTPTWREAVKRFNWQDTDIKDLGEYLTRQQATVKEVVEKLGMAKKQ